MAEYAKFENMPKKTLNYTKKTGQFIFDEKKDDPNQKLIPVSNSSNYEKINIGLYKDDIFYFLILDD